MKKQIFSAVVTGCLLALMIAVPAHAQMPGTTIRATIPFDFIVRGKTLPAGNYEKRDHVLFETEPVETMEIPNESEIVFHRYGDSYFLSEVFTAGEETGQELTTSRAERRLRSEMASNKANAETVAVAAY